MKYNIFFLVKDLFKHFKLINIHLPLKYLDGEGPIDNRPSTD